MKKIININFHSRVIPIEETAYDILRKYVESLKKHFAGEEGADEIVNDIEDRFAELFSDRLKAALLPHLLKKQVPNNRTGYTVPKMIRCWVVFAAASQRI